MGGMQQTSKATDRALLIRWRRDSDITARTALVERYLPFAQALARRYMQRGEQLDDLEQTAALALVRAIDRYDLERDVALTTFVMPTVVGELRRHFRDRVWAVHVPRSVHDLATRLGRVSTELTTRLGRAPSVAELAARAGAAARSRCWRRWARWQAVMRRRCRWATSPPTAGRRRWPTPIPASPTSTVRLALGPALATLDDRERRLIELRFVHGPVAVARSRARLGMSQMHVSRLLRRALTRLEDQLHRDELAY